MGDVVGTGVGFNVGVLVGETEGTKVGGNVGDLVEGAAVGDADTCHAVTPRNVAMYPHSVLLENVSADAVHVGVSEQSAAPTDTTVERRTRACRMARLVSAPNPTGKMALDTVLWKGSRRDVNSCCVSHVLPSVMTTMA